MPADAPSDPPFDLRALLPRVVGVAEQAAAGVSRIYGRDFQVEYKGDHSPLTEADLFAHETIRDGLAQIEPRLPLLSEESTDIPFSERSAWESYWLVDPLDGTREFVNRRDDFTVNIALIHRRQSVLGVVYVPVAHAYYSAVSGGGAYKHMADGTERVIRARDDAQGEPVIAVSFSHSGKTTKAFLEKIGRHRLVRRGSLLKCCLIAEGEVDLYPRFGNTCEWDTAAGQCILEEAGGSLTDFSGNPLRYNTKDSLINPFFVAAGPAAPNWRAYV